MAANLKTAMKYFMQAMQLDERGNNQQAYVEYLSCLQYISGALFEDAKAKSSADTLVTAESQKMVNLIQNCTERLAQLQAQLANAAPQQQHSVTTATPGRQRQTESRAHSQVPELPSPPSEPPGTATQMDGHIKPVPAARKQPVTNSRSPTHAARSTKKSYDQLSPMEKAYRENRILMEAYSARLRRMAGSKNKSAVNLTFQRRLMENMAIAKEREKQLTMKIKERHEHLQRLAAEKFSKDDIELQNTYARILEYENVNTWIQEQHERLRASPMDAQVVQKLIGDIIGDHNHPFSQLIGQYQEAVMSKLEPLIEGKEGEHVMVPLPGVTVLELCEPGTLRTDSFKEPKLKNVMFDDDFMARLLTFRNSERYEEMLRDVGQDIVSWEEDEMFEELIDELIIESAGSPAVSPPQGHGRGDTEASPNGNVPAGCPVEEGPCDIDAEVEEETPASVVDEFREVRDEVRDDLKTAVAMGEDSSSNREADESGYDEYSVDGDEDTDMQSSEAISQDGETSTGLGDTKENRRDASGGSQDERELGGCGRSPEGGENIVEEDAESVKSDPATSPKKESKDAETEEVKVERLQAEALERHLENLSKEIRGMIEKLVSLLVAVYDELANAVAKEQCLTIIESHFFPAVWPMLFKFFRRINHRKEHQTAIAMTRYLHALPEHIGIAQKFCLKTDGAPSGTSPYQGVVQELLKVDQYTCPADKIECLVRVSGSVIQCVNDFHESQGETKHITVGCDDLLPILSFVLLKSGLPSVVSEIHAMEMFIQDGYLFGKEGYCLTTVQTALSYVFKLSEE